MGFGFFYSKMNSPPFLVNLDDILENVVEVEDASKINLSANNKYKFEKQLIIKNLFFNKEENCFIFDLDILDAKCDIAINFQPDTDDVSLIFYVDNVKYSNFTYARFFLSEQKKQQLHISFKNNDPKDFKLSFDCIVFNYETKNILSRSFRTKNLVYYNQGIYEVLYRCDAALNIYVVQNTKTQSIYSFIGK
jgi:hypothetical protein